MSTISKVVTGTIVVMAAIVLLVVLVRRPAAPSFASEESTVASPTNAAVVSETPDRSGEIQNLKGRLSEEMRARQRAEAELAASRQPGSPAQTNAGVALAKVEELGKFTGTFLPVAGELQALSGRDRATLSADEKRRLLELQRQQARLLGALPEITAYQDKPEEYGRFFRSLIQEAAGLNDAQATQVEDFMRQRATLMNQLGLNAAQEPKDPKLEEAWEERRDQFNEQTADALKGILPPGAAEKAGVGSELMEFLEMDFDKVIGKPSAAAVQ